MNPAKSPGHCLFRLVGYAFNRDSGDVAPGSPIYFRGEEAVA